MLKKLGFNKHRVSTRLLEKGFRASVDRFNKLDKAFLVRPSLKSYEPVRRQAEKVRRIGKVLLERYK